MTRRHWTRFAAILGAVAAGLGAPSLADDAIPNEPPAAEPEAITIRGVEMRVWPFDDLRARGFDIPEIAREDNAFWDYLEAVNAFQAVPEDLQAAFDYALSTAWPVGHDEKLKAFLLDERNQKALEIARRASAREQFQGYYFGDPNGSIISVLLPSLSDYRMLSKLLVADGRRLEQQGAYDLALQNYAASMRMAHHVAGGVTLIENLVGVAIWSVADRAISQMVLRRDLSAEQLEDIFALLDELREALPSTRAGVRNERVFGNSMVDEMTAQPFRFPSNIAALSGGGVDPPLTQPTSNWRLLEARFGRLLLPDRTVKAHMNGYYDELIDRADKPAYAARWHDGEEEDMVEAIPQWDVFSRMLLPSLSRASVLGERLRMQNQATRISLALRLFAQGHDGEAPSRLGELVDRLPADELIDPFSGKEFIYAHRAGAWRFYSVSENYTDDGGKTGDNPYTEDYVVRFPVGDIEPFVPEGDAVAQ